MSIKIWDVLKLMAKKYSLAIVLVNYNGSFWLKKTLSSLHEYYLKKTKNKVEVWLVDNASTDDSLVMTKRDYPQVKIIAAHENLGFAKANNLALKEIKTDYIMLLNSDTQLDERSQIDQLINYLDANRDVGLISPKLILTHGEIDPACHRGEPTLWASLTYFLKLEKLFPRCRLFNQYHLWHLDLNQIHEVQAISGAAVITPKHALDKVGLLDEDFFLYAEDLDWCKRYRDQGYKIIYYPDVIITHHKNKSGIDNQDAKIKSKSRTYFYQTMLQYYDKHYSQKYPQWLRSLIKSFIFIKKEGF